MELFSLLAKLTLDKSEYDKGIKEAESDSAHIEIEDPKLGLDKDEFDEGIEEANDAEVDNPEEPELDLDKDEFDEGIDEANDAEVDNPDTPELTIDTDDFDRGIEEAQEKGEGFGSIMADIFNEIKGALAVTGIVAAVSGIVSSLSEAIDMVKNYGDQVDKQSQKMHLSAQAYQEWDYALGLAGSSITDLQRGLRTWQTAVGDEKKTLELSEAFNAIGVNAEWALKEIENAAAGKGTLDAVLSSTIGALANYEGGDAGAIGKVLFGNGFDRLSALLNQTGEEINDALKEADDLGLVMTDEEVKNAAAYMDATTRLEKSIDALKMSFVSEIIPILTDAANWLAEIVAKFNWRTGDKSLADQFNELDQAVASSITSLEEREVTAKKLLESISELGDYWTLDDKGKKTWDTLAEELIKLYPELDGVIDTNSKTIKANTDEITKNIEEWTKLEEQKLLDQNLADKRAAIAKQYADALDKEVEAEVKEAEAEGKRATAIEQVNDIIKKNEELRSAVMGAFGTDTLTAENASEILNFIREKGFQTNGMGALDEWVELQNKAEELRKTASEMNEEADAATQEYEKFADALAKKLGITINDEETATQKANELKTAVDSIPDYKRIKIVEEKMGYSHAIGSAYIPYDNYPALLHRGEKVLTATEARQTENVDYTQMENRIIAAIREGMSGANVQAFINGRDVTDEVSRDLANQLTGRRYG